MQWPLKPKGTRGLLNGGHKVFGRLMGHEELDKANDDDLDW